MTDQPQPKLIGVIPCRWASENDAILRDEQANSEMLAKEDKDTLVVLPTGVTDPSFIRLERLEIRFQHPELPGQGKFGRLFIRYTPMHYCLTVESLQAYLKSWAKHGAYYEDCVDTILNHLWEALTPMFLEVEGEFDSHDNCIVRVERNRSM